MGPLLLCLLSQACHTIYRGCLLQEHGSFSNEFEPVGDTKMDARSPTKSINGTEKPHDVLTCSMSSQMMARAPGRISGVGQSYWSSGVPPGARSFSYSGEPRSKTLPGGNEIGWLDNDYTVVSRVLLTFTVESH